MRLGEIFWRHDCDRLKHGYERIYEKLPPPKRMLEIGIFKGAGIASWLEWWPEAQITGLDTFQRLAANKIPILRDPRVTWWRGDSRVLKGIEGPFDIIMDDGDHHPDAQWETFKNLGHLMAPDGVYFIEDCRVYDPEFTGLLTGLEGFEVIHHDLRKHHQPDSYLLEIRR